MFGICLSIYYTSFSCPVSAEEENVTALHPCRTGFYDALEGPSRIIASLRWAADIKQTIFASKNAFVRYPRAVKNALRLVKCVRGDGGFARNARQVNRCGLSVSVRMTTNVTF